MNGSNDPLVGTTLDGRYTIERQLGMGGMGAVYLARQEPLGREVALKVLRPDLLGDPIALERFRNEAKVIAQVGHPHIVGVHDFGTTREGLLFIAMEYLEGETLSSLLKTRGHVPWQRSLRIVRDVARALAAAHRRGVVHRDLKPENVILVDAEGIGDFVKVLDFGIAKVVSQRAHTENLTGTGFVPGTPGYIAPEQVLGGGDDPRSDLYALGVTWFEMLTRRRPFLADGPMKVFLAQLEQQPPRLRSLLPDVPVEVDALVAALLEPDPDGRPQTAEALLSRLDELAASGLFVPSGTATPAAGSELAVPQLPRELRGGDLPPDMPTAPAATTPSTPSTPSVPTGVAPFSLDALASVAAPTALASGTPSTGVSTTLAQPTPLAKPAPPKGKRGLALLAAGLALVVVVGGIAVGVHFKRRHMHAELPVPLLLDEREVEADLVRAFEAYFAGETALAGRTADRVLARSPDEPGAHLLKGVLHEREGDFTARDRHIRHAVDALGATGSLCGSGEELLGLAGRLVGADAAAVTMAWKGCAPCKESLFAHLVVAELLANENLGGYEEALTLLEAASRIAPDAVLPYVDRVRILTHQDRIDEAVATAKAGLKLDKGSPALKVALARSLLARGDYAEAAAQLEAAGGLSAGPEASILLAKAWLFLGKEDARKRVVETALTAPPAVRADIVQAHGAALVGAGRGGLAQALFVSSVRDSLDALEAYQAALTVLIGMQAQYAAERIDDVLALSRLGDEVLKAPELPHAEADLLKAVQLLATGILADRHGDDEAAKTVLRRLESAAQLPPQGREGILNVLRAKVYAHEAGGKERALAAATAVHHRCRALIMKARIHRAAGDLEPARAIYRQLVGMQAWCKHSQFEGAYVMEALADLVELHAEAGEHEEARAALTELEALFPFAEASTPALQRARKALVRAR